MVKKQIQALKTKRGFTLTELLVVMAITSLFAIISMPFSYSLYEEHQLNYNTNILLNTLQRASDLAKANNQVVTVKINEAGNNTQQVLFYQPPADIQITTDNSGTKVFYIRPDGYFQTDIINAEPVTNLDVRLCRSAKDAKTSRTIIIRGNLIASDGMIVNNCNFT